MVKLIKRLLGVLGIVFLLLIVAVVSLPFIIDPNDFKSEIQTVAAKQGVDLTLGGPISWQFYPTLGLSLQELSVAPITEPDQKLAQIQEVTAAVAVIPLFKRQVRVEKLLVDGANIQLTVNKQGQGNWQALSAPSDSSAPTTTNKPNADKTDSNKNASTTNSTAENTATSPLDLTINSIQLSQANLVYDDQQGGQRTELNNVDLRISDVNLNQRSFPLSLAMDLGNSTLAQAVHIELRSQVKANNELTLFDLNDAVLTVNKAKVEIKFSAHATTDPALQFNATLDTKVGDLASLFSMLDIERPITADPNVLSKFQLVTTIDGSDKAVKLQNLKLVLDDTTLTGNADVEFPSEQKLLSLNLTLDGDRLNVDRYLAPTREDAAVASSPTSDVDSPLPLESLRSVNVTAQANVKELVVNKMPITDLALALQGKQGLWQLQKLNAGFYQGKLSSNGEFDARNSQATMKFTATMADLAIKPLLVDMAEIDVLSGTVEMTVNGNTRAATTHQIVNNLNATANFTGNKLVATGFNVEQSYCQMVKQLKDDTATNAEKNWADETAINSVDGQIVFANNQLDVKKLQAQIGNLVLAAKANLNLIDQQYQVSLPLRLTNEKTSATGCQVNSKFLLDREVDVIGCQGSMAPMDFAKQCGLRSGAVTDLAKQALRYNFDKQGGNEKVDAAKEEAEEKVDEKKQEVREKAKDKLKDLLKR